MLKLLAVLTMLVDHIGLMFFPGQTGWRMLGRIAMPLFAFCIARGFTKTRDLGRYLSMLAVFAVISQVPYSLMLETRGRDPLQGSIMVTWVVALFLLMGIAGRLPVAADELTSRIPVDVDRRVLQTAWRLVFIVGSLTVSRVVPMDYGWYGVLLPAIFYLVWFTDLVKVALRYPLAILMHWALTMLWIWRGGTGDIQLLSVAATAALPILTQYENRIKLRRLFFYWFYPVHIAGLVLLHAMLG